MDDAQKQKAMIALAAFSVTVSIYQLLFNSSKFSLVGLLLGFLLGGIIGGAAYGISHYLQNR